MAAISCPAVACGTGAVWLVSCNNMVTHRPTLKRVFRAAADPTRRQILRLLANGESSAGNVAASFRVSRPAVSRHLRVLRNAQLVTERRDGRERVYSLDAWAFSEIDHWLHEYRHFWRDSLARLKRHVESSSPGSRK